jgi:hypothetical protein
MVNRRRKQKWKGLLFMLVCMHGWNVSTKILFTNREKKGFWQGFSSLGDPITHTSSKIIHQYPQPVKFVFRQRLKIWDFTNQTGVSSQTTYIFYVKSLKSWMKVSQMKGEVKTIPKWLTVLDSYPAHHFRSILAAIWTQKGKCNVFQRNGF